jgi:rsbT co-antagonist protein RsbR
MLGNHLTMLMPDYLRHLHDTGLSRYVETGKKHISWEGVELPGLHKSGREIPLEVSFGEFIKDNKRFFTGIARDITERKRAEEERALLQEEMIRMQDKLLAELSTPLIPISKHIVIMPLIGAMDSRRAEQMLDTLLRGIEKRQARVAIIDITGVPTVDAQVAARLVQAAQAVRLLGAQVIITGIRAEVALALVRLGVEMDGLMTHSDLYSGIAHALGLNHS